MESAWMVRGDDAVEESVESLGGGKFPKEELLFDRNEDLEYGCVTNLGCECDRRSVLDEK